MIEPFNVLRYYRSYVKSSLTYCLSNNRQNYGTEHDMLSRLNHQNLCFFAVLASIVSTLIISLTTEIYNNDAYSYIRAAELITDNGLQAEIKNYTWLGYSSLIAGFGQLGFDLFQAGLLVNGAMHALLIFVFIKCSHEIGGNVTTTAMAALVILLYPQLNEYRSLIIRDMGFWAFSMLGLWQLLIISKKITQLVDTSYSQILPPAFIFTFATLFAILFRVEAILYLLLCPISLAFHSAKNKKNALHSFYLTGLIAISSLFLLYFFLSINSINLFVAFQNLALRYEPFLESNIFSYRAQASSMSAALFGEYGAAFSNQYLSIFLIGGFVAMILATIFNTAGLPLGLLIIYGIKKYKSYFADILGNNKRVIAVYVGVNLLILTVFVFTTRFSSNRYSVLLCIIGLLFVPIVIEKKFLEYDFKKQKIFSLCVGLIFFFCFIDSFFSFGRSKSFINEANVWIENHPSVPLLTNNYSIAYASGRVKNYDQTKPFIDRDDLMNLPGKALIAVEYEGSLTKLNEVLEESEVQTYVTLSAVFPKTSSDLETAKIVIFERNSKMER